MAQQAVLAIDEGTTSSRALLLSNAGEIIASGTAPVPIHHPRSGWVQQAAMEIRNATAQAVTTRLNAATWRKAIARTIAE